MANPNYIYAYVYNLKSKTWHKITDKYSVLIPNYPELYAIRTKRSGLEGPYTYSNKVVNISSESSGSTQCLFITRAVSFDAPDRFKKLRRTFLRGILTSTASKNPALYIFRSDDLVNWTFVTGNDTNTDAFKDIWVTHSRNSSRNYIFVFTGDLSTSDSIVNQISKLEIEFELKMQSKLR